MPGPTSPAAAPGVIHTRSRATVDETVERLETLLQSKGIALFALVDHASGAKSVGMTMRPTVLLIFGKPEAGTPLMVAAPSLALDLPLKILVWEDGDGAVWMSYNSAAYLGERHHVPGHLLQNLAVVDSLVASVSA